MSNFTATHARSQPTPGSTDFKHFVKYVQEHEDLPDNIPINGNMGRFHAIASTLSEQFIEFGYPGFQKALEQAQKNDLHVNLALSIADTPQEAPVGVLLSDVKAEPIHWLWPHRLALRKLHILDGDPGLGKTTIMLDLIARLTTGRNMPEEEGRALTGGAVLICLEDGLADTIQPRLARVGAKLSKVVSIGYIPEKDADGKDYERPFDLAKDLDLLESAIKRVDAKLVIIDPVMAILGGKDTYKDNEVRAALAPLKALAERCNVAIVMIRHVNKGGGDKAIYLGGGSIAFIGLARIGLLVVKNPDNENQCILANIKNNLSMQAPKLLYSVVADSEDGDERPYIKWEGTSTHTDQEIISKPTQVPGTGRQEILHLLKEAYPDKMSLEKIIDTLKRPGNSESNIKMTLARMVEDDQIVKAARGMYTAHSGLSASA